MKALTISQPFATLIADGKKWVENRTWVPSYRGQLAIHAGKRSDYLDPEELRNYPTGCIVAVAVLAACISIKFMKQMSELCLVWPAGKTLGEILAHEHTEGPWCWVLTNVRKLEEPIFCRGAQGLWDWECGEFEKAEGK